jgi:predicted DCC family thiol-disulfide oxidoreductase YuxK
MSSVQKNDVWIVYDGDCPFCTHYVRYLRIKESSGHPPHLVNAREEWEKVKELGADKFDLSNGMIVKLGDTHYHGGDAIHILSLMSTTSGIFNKFVHLTGRNKIISRLIYPLLRAGRNCALALLRKNRHFNN